MNAPLSCVSQLIDRLSSCSDSARDYVEGMWLMLQQPTPDDFVLATGETHQVREFVNKSFNALGIQLKYVSIAFIAYLLSSDP